MFIKSLFQRVLSILGRFRQENLRSPREVVIEVTNRCNLNCGICFNRIYCDNRTVHNELSTKSIRKIIALISHSSVSQIRFSGGEPLIRDDIFTLIEYAHSKGLRVWLNTNATLVDDRVAQFLSQHVENVLIPLNAFDVISEKLSTNNSLFKKKLKGMLLLRKTNIKTIRCGTVTTRENIQNLERIYRLLLRLRADAWELFRPIPLNSVERPIDNRDAAILIEKLIKINEEGKNNYKIYNALPFCCYNPEKVMRVAHGAESDDGHTRFVIDSGGHAKPMYYLMENIGDPLRHTVLEIWNHDFMRQLRTLQLVPFVCKKCKYLKQCKGGSRIVSKLVTNTYDGLDYLAKPQLYKSMLFNS